MREKKERNAPSRSIRNQITILMTAIIVFQNIILVLALFLTNVFGVYDTESFRMFNDSAQTRAWMINSSISELMHNMVYETEKLNNSITNAARMGGISPGEIYLDDAMYLSVADEAAETLVSIIQNNRVTGAYMILNGSNADGATGERHSAVYIRNTAMQSSVVDASKLQMEIGPASVAKSRQIALSVYWDIDISMDIPGGFYDDLASGVIDNPGRKLSDYGFWTNPISMLADNQQVVTYSLPLEGPDGEIYGVIGCEISLPHFSRQYLPDSDMPYQNGFYIISPVSDEAIDLSWYIPAGPLAEVYLKGHGSLPISRGDSSNLPTTSIAALGEMYCSINTIELYDEASIFYRQNLSMVTMVPRSVLHESSSRISSIIIGIIVLTTILAFMGITLLARVSTLKIEKLAEYIKSIRPSEKIEFEKTGYYEIDELAGAAEFMSRNVINSMQLTSKIIDLTDIPMGTFEISAEMPYAIITDFIRRIMDVPGNQPIEKEDWEQFYRHLTANKVESYDNVYFYNNRWLRIRDSETEHGYVGSILDISEDVERNIQLENRLDHDELTGTYSRMAFYRRATAMLGKLPEKVGALMFINLDNVKYINDRFGHEAGDSLIIRAAQILGGFNEHGGIVSRLSSDEFAILLHGYDSKEQVRAVIARHFDNAEEWTVDISGGAPQRVRMSTGISWYPEDAQRVSELIKLADFAMLDVKSTSKGSIREFDKKRYEDSAFLIENSEAIHSLLEDRLITFVYQPIVDLRTGEIYGYEMLMRSLHKDFRSPLEILSVAESQGMMNKLEHLVMTEAHRHAYARKEQLKGRKVFINSISNQTLSPEDRLRLVQDYGDMIDDIVIEMTEENNYSITLLSEKVDSIHKMGYHVAIDDYGTGYSNELRVLSINVDIVKVDQAIIQGIHLDEDKRFMLKSLVSLCRSKNIKVLAEGVENEDDLGVIISLGVDYVQGYLLGRPEFDIKEISDDMVAKILDMSPRFGAE